MIDSTKIISEYLGAFHAANPDRNPPRVTYEKGWFVIVDRPGYLTRSRYRSAALQRMTDTLRDRGINQIAPHD